VQQLLFSLRLEHAPAILGDGERAFARRLFALQMLPRGDLTKKPGFNKHGCMRAKK